MVAKPGRPARNAAFPPSPSDAGVGFMAVGMPQANRLTVGIMALAAEDGGGADQLPALRLPR